MTRRMRTDVRAIAFDVNGTLIEIVTDEGTDEIFRAAAHFLTYQGIDLRRHELRDLYAHILKSQRQASAEDHPEFDAVAIWQTVITRHQTLLLPSAASPHVPTCTFPRSVFPREAPSVPTHRWRDRGLGFVVGAVLCALAWWWW